MSDTPNAAPLEQASAPTPAPEATPASPAAPSAPAASFTAEDMDKAAEGAAPQAEGGTQGAQGTPAPAEPHWSSSLPEALRDLAKDFGTAEEAKAALERGKGYTPATKVEDITITFAQDVQVNQAEQDSFKKLCVEKGITPSQAQDLATWQLDSQRTAMAAHKVQSENTLRAEWGQNYEANTGIALRALTNLDRKMGGTLAPTLRASNMHNDATFIRALYTVGTMLQEDTLNGTEGSAPQNTETAKQAFEGMFDK